MRFSILLLLLPLVSSMDMVANDKSNLPSQNQNISDIIPVAHETNDEHGLPILETNLSPAERLYWESYNTTTYFTIESNKKSALWYHCFSLFACFIFLYPISMMLDSIKSKWYIPVLTIYQIVLISSLISLKVYGNSIPDLFPNNAYAKMSWILLFSSLIQYVIAILYSASKWVLNAWLENDDRLDQPFIPLEDLDIERLADSDTPSTLINSNRSSGDNDNGRENSPETIYKRDSLELDEVELDQGDSSQGGNFFKKNYSKNSFTSTKRDNLLNKLFQNQTILKFSSKFNLLISILFNCFKVPMFGYLFIYASTGVAVGSLLAQGNHVFGVLAHFIKGGVFVSLGVFSLARYCGVLHKYGLAWNKAVVLKNQVNTRSIWYKLTPHGMITMEGYESFLIFFYGITNIFLEHLASPGGVWDAKDLQHVSIAFMYIGSGLCGLITEYILSEWRFNQFLSNTKINSDAIHAGTPGYSPNPFPVFTIFWTGILMSQHKQSSATSTMIHMQWGYLFAYGSFFRLLTFVLLMLVPNKNLISARPFTELITSFCLMCGGFIFMQSNDQTVQALEYRGLTSMFTLNVNVGIVALLMAWEMLLLIWKSRLQSSKQV